MPETLAPESVTAQLERILNSPPLESSPSLCRFLRYVVEETLAGRGGQIERVFAGRRGLRSRRSVRSPHGPDRPRAGAQPARTTGSILRRARRIRPDPDRSAQAHLRSGLSREPGGAVRRTPRISRHRKPRVPPSAVAMPNAARQVATPSATVMPAPPPRSSGRDQPAA